MGDARLTSASPPRAALAFVGGADGLDRFCVLTIGSDNHLCVLRVHPSSWERTRWPRTMRFRITRAGRHTTCGSSAALIHCSVSSLAFPTACGVAAARERVPEQWC